MAAVPVSPLAPGDAGYSTVRDLWIAQGRSQYVEDLAAGWLRLAIFPNGGTQPTFVLFASALGSSSADLTTGVTGLSREMVTSQNTIGAHLRDLPKKAV